MDNDEIRKAARSARREAVLGPDAACAICGEHNPDALRLVKRTLLDEHHVAGEFNLPDLKVPVCANCHRVLHARLLDEGLDFARPAKRIVLEALYYLVLASSVMFREMSKAYEAMARQLRRLIASLDANYDNWRELPEAQL